MRTTKKLISPLLKLAAFAIFALILVLIIELKPTNPASVGALGTPLLASDPVRGSTSTSADAYTMGDLSPVDPYPVPNPTIESEPPLPAKVQALVGKKSSLGNVNTVTLDRGQIWLIPAQDHPKKITDFKDVAVIYGWNHDGTKLLLGRGVYNTSGELAKSTELWIYNLMTDDVFRLLESTKVWSATWSPVDDRVAFSEYGEPPSVSIINLDGKVLRKRESLYIDIAWSPDGSSLAVSYVGPEMIEFETKFPVIGIWTLETDELQLINDATRENHGDPIWTMDGNHLIFYRSFGPGSGSGKDGLYRLDINSKEMTLLPHSPETFVGELRRSPRGDFFLSISGKDLFVMDYNMGPIFIGKGAKPVWHPSGKTIFFYDNNDQLQVFELDLPVREHFAGGSASAAAIHLQPDLSFSKE